PRKRARMIAPDAPRPDARRVAGLESKPLLNDIAGLIAGANLAHQIDVQLRLAPAPERDPRDVRRAQRNAFHPLRAAARDQMIRMHAFWRYARCADFKPLS